MTIVTPEMHAGRISDSVWRIKSDEMSSTYIDQRSNDVVYHP
jgi:hypothetical protein